MFTSSCRSSCRGDDVGYGMVRLGPVLGRVGKLRPLLQAPAVQGNAFETGSQSTVHGATMCNASQVCFLEESGKI